MWRSWEVEEVEVEALKGAEMLKEGEMLKELNCQVTWKL